MDKATLEKANKLDEELTLFKELLDEWEKLGTERFDPKQAQNTLFSHLKLMSLNTDLDVDLILQIRDLVIAYQMEQRARLEEKFGNL